MYKLGNILASRIRAGQSWSEAHCQSLGRGPWVHWPYSSVQNQVAEMWTQSYNTEYQLERPGNGPTVKLSRELQWAEAGVGFPGSFVLLRILWQVGGLAPFEWPGTGHTAPAYCWSPSPGEQVGGNETNILTPSLVLRGSVWFYLPLVPWGGHTLTNLVVWGRRETCGTEPDPMCSLMLPEQAQPSSVDPSRCPCYAGGS